jgi:hypothetical protein
MKGQTSLELLVTVGIVIAFTIPVLFLLLSVTSVGYEDTAKAQAEAASRTLADTMNSVYSQGDGAKREILLNVPATTQEVLVRGRSGDLPGGEVVIRIKTSSGIFEAVHPTIAKIRGTRDSVGMKTGLFLVVVENIDGEVDIFEPTS